MNRKATTFSTNQATGNTSCKIRKRGPCHPPRNSKVATHATVIMFAYFRHEEHGEFHRAVLGVISGNELSFRLGQVEGNAIRLGVSRGQVNEEGHKLALKNIPLRNNVEPRTRLRRNDLLQTETARVTEWPELAGLLAPEVKDAMRNPLIVDGRNMLDPAAARAAGFRYEGVGRPATATPDPAPAPEPDTVTP